MPLFTLFTLTYASSVIVVHCQTASALQLVVTLKLTKEEDEDERFERTVKYRLSAVCANVPLK